MILLAGITQFQVQPQALQRTGCKGCVACRYLTDHMECLPLGVMSRIVTGNDSLLALVPLLERKPWQRRRVGCSIDSVEQNFTPMQIGTNRHSGCSSPDNEMLLNGRITAFYEGKSQELPEERGHPRHLPVVLRDLELNAGGKTACSCLRTAHGCSQQTA